MKLLLNFALFLAIVVQLTSGQDCIVCPSGIDETKSITLDYSTESCTFFNEQWESVTSTIICNGLKEQGASCCKVDSVTEPPASGGAAPAVYAPLALAISLLSSVLFV